MENTNKPNGGFPPILICDYKKKKTDDEEDENNKKIRGFTTNEQKIVVSLKEIMGERRKETTPFIEL